MSHNKSLPFRDLAAANIKANLGRTQIHTRTCANIRCVYVSSSCVRFGGLLGLHKIFSPGDGSCFASQVRKDVTKILILAKQIATDSLTGQNLQVNRIKNSNIDPGKQIAAD